MPNIRNTETEDHYSSRLTRQLVEQAESMLSGLDLDSVTIDEQVAALDSQTKPDAAFELKASDDRMSLYLSIQPANVGPTSITTQAVHTELNALGIQHGIKNDAILLAVADAEHGQVVKDRIVVAGRAPVQPGEYRVVFFGRNGTAEIAPVEKDRLSQLSTNPVICEAGDTIAMIHPGTPGRDGYTATGDVLPYTPVKAPDLRAGNNVVSDTRRFMASIAGVMTLRDGLLQVSKVLILNNDIDRHSSPIWFDGSITINGGVRSGVEITATDTIRIAKIVEDAIIRSVGGDVILQAGIAGRNRGMIEAGNDVVSGFVENATVRSGRDITLHIGSINSRLTAGNNINADTGKGSIAGGTLIAGHNITIKRIGSPGTTTTAIAGVSSDVLTTLSEISREIMTCNTRIHDIDTVTTQFERQSKDLSRLTKKEQATYANLKKLRIITEQQLNDRLTHRDQVLRDSVSCSHGSIRILLELGASVDFHLGHAQYKHDETTGPITLTFDPDTDKVVCRRA